MRARSGRVDPVHVLLYYMMKSFAPGGADEKVQLINSVRNPNVCSQPRAAQVELLRWKENLRRCAQLGCYPPDVVCAYQAMESIFSSVFDKAEPLLHSRWVNLRNSLGLPHVINVQAIEQVSKFAEAELGALVLHGGAGLNTGLPLTDNQKNRQNQIKETEKKRVAALRAAQQQPQPQPQPQQAQAAAVTIDGVRCTSTTSSWASPCRDWDSTKLCKRGISCHFAHKGFPVSESRCITCGAGDHKGNDCKAPGGGADPDRQKTWDEYRKRKEAAAAQGNFGLSKGGKKGGKGTKGKDGKGGKGKGKPDGVRAAYD